MGKSNKPENIIPIFFQFFNEIGIIEQLSRAVMEARLPDGFLISHFGVLNHLERLGGGKTPLSIAKAFQVPKTTMTHTLAGLEKHAFVEIKPNPKDGRSKLVWLTQAGLEFRNTAIAELGPDIYNMSKYISPGKINEITPKLADIRSILDQMRNED